MAKTAAKIRLPVEICVQQYLIDGTYLGLTRDLSGARPLPHRPRMKDDLAL